MKKYRSLIVVSLVVAILAGCSDAATVASKNASTAADNFEIPRRISIVNGITDKVAAVTEGYCSLKPSDVVGRIAIVCMQPDGTIIKNFLDKSDNTFVLTEQLVGADVSTFHYRTVFRPQSLIPDIDFQGDAGQLKKAITPD